MLTPFEQGGGSFNFRSDLKHSFVKTNVNKFCNKKTSND